MKHCLLLLLITLCSVTSLMARPADPNATRTLTLADGTKVQARLMGDEFGHFFQTADGRFLLPVGASDSLYQFVTLEQVQRVNQQVTDQRHAAIRKAPLTTFPTIGEIRGLVILTEFQDQHFQEEYNNDLFQRQMNESGYAEYKATGSARDYFIAQSDSLFMPQFDVIGPILLPYEMSYYGRNNGYDQDSNPGLMIKHACEIAHDSLGIDFSQYDFDNNGEVDFVFCLYAGYGESYGAVSYTIWPHMSNLNSQYIYLDLDGKSINRYACSCELSGNTGTKLDGIGAFCHEFGHVLGLPDLYNTLYSSNVQLGSWDIMDSGSYNNNSRTPPYYSAFERYSLGWMELTDLTEPGDSLTLGELTSTWQAYRIPTYRPNEYFILENRQQQGWDRYQAAKGLMITHIDYEETFWDNNTVNSSLHPHVDLVEADGSQGSPFSTDLYPIEGNDMFTDYSSPNSLLWDGTPNERGVSRIRQEDDGTISFAYMRDRLKRPELLEATDITDTSFCAHWLPVDEATAYRLHLLELLPDSINDLYFLLDGETIPEDWQTTEVYEEDGLLRIGSYGVSGSLVSPYVELLSGNTSMTLCFDARSYPGKSVNFDVIIEDAEGNVIDQQTLKATRNIERHLLHYENCPSNVRLTLKSNKERLFIDELRLVAGLRDTAEVFAAGPAEWEIDCNDVTEYLVTGLKPERSYTYEVMAIDTENEMRNSLASASQTIVTLPADETAIEPIGLDTHTAPTRSYDLMGRPIGTQQGLFIQNGKLHFAR